MRLQGMTMDKKRCFNCMGEIEADSSFCRHCGFNQTTVTQPANALFMGTMLFNRYYIGKVIGQGGFGITYVGWDTTLDMKVAVKEYFPSGEVSRTTSYSSEIQWDYGSDEERKQRGGLDRFLNEARRMARLDTLPSVVRVRDAFQANGTAYIVMDFVEGVTLKNYLLSNGVLRYEACMKLLSPILDSLAAIHDHGFIHRDISPDNIMLQPDGTVRLLDMGAAVDVRATAGHASMALVKRNFSAPEQYMESEVLGSWTDVYAMSATIYYCLTGKVVPEALEREFKKTPLFFDPSLNIPAYAIAALEGGLALHALERIRDMRELKRRLTLSGLETEMYEVPKAGQAEQPSSQSSSRQEDGQRGVDTQAAAYVSSREAAATQVEDSVGPTKPYVAPVEEAVGPTEPYVAQVEEAVGPTEPYVAPVEEHREAEWSKEDQRQKNCVHGETAEITTSVKPPEPSKPLLGIVGAIGGSLIGVILWLVLGRLGLISGIAGVVMLRFAFKGYEKLGGRLDKKGVIISLVVMIFMIAEVNVLDYWTRDVEFSRLFKVAVNLHKRPSYWIEEMTFTHRWGEFIINLLLGYALSVWSGFSVIKDVLIYPGKSRNQVAFGYKKITAIQPSANSSKPVHLPLGIVGAIVGALVGGILWIILGTMGLISSIAGLVILKLAFKGYEKLGGRLDKKGVMIALVVTFFIIAGAHAIGYIIVGANTINHRGAWISINQFLSEDMEGKRWFIRLRIQNITLYNLWGEFFGNLLSGYILSILPCFSQMKAILTGWKESQK